MSRVDDLLRSYVAAFRKAGDADPRSYLKQLEGAERAELAALIDGFLAHAPRPAFDPDRFAAFAADPARIEAADAVLGASRTLIELRREARLSKADIGMRLAEALDLPGLDEEARSAYHEIEWGSVEPRRVRPRVWDALSEILGAGVERLRAAAQQSFERRDPAGGLTFARTTGESRAAETPSPAGPPVGDRDRVREAFFEAE